MANVRLPGFGLALLAGLLAVAAVADFAVGWRAERVADLVRPEMTDEGLEQHRRDFETARDTLNGLQLEVIPAVAGIAGTSPQAMEREISETYPAIGELLAQKDEIIPFAEASLANLERQQSNFESADDSPAPGVPAYAGSLVSLLLAAALGGAFMFSRAGNHLRAAAVAGGVAAVLLAVPLVLGIPGKSADGQEVLDSLNPSEALVRRTEGYLDVASAGEAELREQLLPDLADQIGLSELLLFAALNQQFPKVAGGLEEMPEILERYEARFAIREGGASDLRTLKKIPVAQLGWFGPVFGAIVAAEAGWLWLAARKPAAEASTV